MRALVLALLVSACATPATTTCAAGDARTVAHMMFGRNIGDRLGVSEEAWAGFVAREITPRFPEGVSVLDMAGQWRDSDTGAVVREPSKLVVLIVDEAEDDARIGAVADAYKAQFQQQAVGVVRYGACVAFQ